MIAQAKNTTDTNDLAFWRSYASGFLPEVWIADDPTQALRREVTRRNQTAAVARQSARERRRRSDFEVAAGSGIMIAAGGAGQALDQRIFQISMVPR